MSVVTLSFDADDLLDGICAIDCRDFGLGGLRSVEESAIVSDRGRTATEHRFQRTNSVNKGT